MDKFSFGTITSEYGSAWRELRLEGARDFPLGFLLTLEEMAEADVCACRDILSRRNIRGVFDDGKLVGFCGYRPENLEPTKHRAEIGPFFVTRKYHGRGAAAAMMAGVVEEARGSDVERLELRVDTENVAAIRFYERFGFERIAFYGDAVRIEGRSRDEYLYCLRL